MYIIQPIAIEPALAEYDTFLVTAPSAPLEVVPGQLFQVAPVYSNVPEDDYAAWASGTQYAIGDTVMQGHRNWEALTASTGIDPLTDTTAPPAWLDLGPTNRWAMFDESLGTRTERAGSIEVVAMTGKPVDAIALFGVSAGSIRVRAIDPFAGIIFDETFYPVDTSGIADWHAYFFADLPVREDIVITDIGATAFATVEVELTNSGGAVGVGALVMGRLIQLGDTAYGTSVGITDYSRKERDDFGGWVVVERAYSKRVDFDVEIPFGRVSAVQRLLAQYRARPIVWIGEASIEATVVYGYFRDFEIVLSNPALCAATISVEGLT